MSAITSEPRTIKAYAAYKPGLECEPFEYVSRPLGAEDVEIAITHCGICGTDVHTIENGWGNADYPVVPGHEIVGHITAIGASVSHLAIGDRVGVGAMVFSCQDKNTCKECAEERDPYCSKFLFTYNAKYEDGEKTYGGYAEHVRVSSHYAFKIPDELPSDVTAPLLCAGVTVYSPMKEYVKPGDTVGIVGIGGLGHLGIQFARAMDASAIAFSHSPNKEQQARELGANDFIVMSDPESVKRAARSVNVLLVTVDAENQPWDLYLTFIAPRGKLVLVGLPSDRVNFSPFSLVPTGVSFVGSMIGGIQETKEMLELAAKRNVRAVIQKLPMSQVNEGLQLVHEGKVRYRVVLENPAAEEASP